MIFSTGWDVQKKTWISLIGVILMTVPLFVNVSASTGMGGGEPESGQDNPSPIELEMTATKQQEMDQTMKAKKIAGVK